MAPEMDQFYRSTMAIYKVSACAAGAGAQRLGHLWRTEGKHGQAELRARACGLSGGRQPPQRQPEAPGEGFVHSHPVSDRPAELVLSRSLQLPDTGEAGQGPAWCSWEQAARGAAWPERSEESLCLPRCLCFSVLLSLPLCLCLSPVSLSFLSDFLLHS